MAKMNEYLRLYSAINLFNADPAIVMTLINAHLTYLLGKYRHYKMDQDSRESSSQSQQDEEALWDLNLRRTIRKQQRDIISDVHSRSDIASSVLNIAPSIL